ncbi:BlaI/MecI/CopY family transcriptional regulator [Leptobacterium flavescens]|uniref:BlaI/MecI/CopY family transcriptional regulator n=1 Tax=Leptobacterium flavescens TaxID=472055 RepID=A0A6P0UKU4_9FLAO|nr:BlaI/MecI/CopY family transcriptional regulator [Leptobacterium flavescens]NER13587.1 BlaI/MecI/CopY family transcriptional regulator [Leptobacterium flavescens]
MQLSQTEEKLMHFLWKRNRAYMKDLISDFPPPKPAKTTVATLLKRMVEKGFVGYDQSGNAREYYPLVKKKEYSSNRVNGLIKSFFNNSAAQLASFCTTENNLSTSELEALKKIIDEQIEKRKK